MPCIHRFYGAHDNGLFPNWEIETLFIGTFNPSWDHPNNNANYFYARSPYFWRLIKAFYNHIDLTNLTRDEKLNFIINNKIGFTDLIENIENADINNLTDVSKILSFKDSDLLYFEEGLQFNTDKIIEFINDNQNIKNVYFTLLANNIGSITTSINTIENYFINSRREINIKRLHTPTGQGLGAGTPRINKLVHRWIDNGFEVLNPYFNINNFPYEI